MEIGEIGYGVWLGVRYLNPEEYRLARNFLAMDFSLCGLSGNSRIFLFLL